MAGNIPSMHINSVESSTCLSHPPMASCIFMISAEVRNEWRHKTFNFFLLVVVVVVIFPFVVVALISAHAVVWSPPAVLDHDVLGIARISFSSVFFLPLATRPSFLKDDDDDEGC